MPKNVSDLIHPTNRDACHAIPLPVVKNVSFLPFFWAPKGNGCQGTINLFYSTNPGSFSICFGSPIALTLLLYVRLQRKLLRL